MAVKATNKKAKAESFITYVVVKAHDGLQKGEIMVRKAGDRGAEYCVSKGLWKVKVTKTEE